ncbi:MAG: hypothetical protein ACLFRX_09195 [Gemmatimonadota bacterium]
MARYDRIARIDSPPRGRAFNGWFTLRDLEGREREPELGRRVRLRYLALRPVRRLLLRGLERVDGGSVALQVEAVRDELGQLPGQDPERQLLESYLKEIGGGSADGLLKATLDVGAAAEAGGHRFAAEEFYRTALELARTRGFPSYALHALRFLGRVQRDREEWEDAITSYREAAALAESMGERVEWGRSMEGLAAVHLRRGDVPAARKALDRIRGTNAGRELRAIAAAGTCALELAIGNSDEALSAGWEAVTHLPAGDEARNGVLLNMAAAFRRLGLHEAAGSCYEIVMRWAAWPEHRIEAGLEYAVVAAEAGDPGTFVTRRAALLDSLAPADRPLRALVDLGLGRGALLVDDTETAREHLRGAIATARDLDDARILERAEELLASLENESRPTLEHDGDASSDARRIAESVESILAVAARSG